MSVRGPRVGLVLGGGGIAGYAFNSGVLTALEATTGFDPRTAEILIGTSAGAIGAALLRGDIPASTMSDRLLADEGEPAELETLRELAGPAPRAVPRVWAGPGAPTMAVRELRRGRGLRVSKLVAALLPRGRSSLGAIIEPLTRLHPAGWPDRPLWIPATDLRTGRLSVFGRPGGRWPAASAMVGQAVEASAALPLYFAPVEIEGRRYIDGGLGSPYNIDLLINYRAGGPDGPPLDLVIVLAPLSVDETNRLAPISSVARSVPRRRLRNEIRRIEKAGTTTLVIEPDRAVARAMGLNPMAPERVSSIVEQSWKLFDRQLGVMPTPTLELLERAGRCLPSPPDVAYPAG